MRKLLLTTSALVAATGLASYAVADVSVSGAYEFAYSTASTDDTDTDGDSYSSVAEVAIKFTNKTDSGLTVSGLFDMDIASDAEDEASMTIAGGFGSITLGQNDTAADAFGMTESDVIAEDATAKPGSSTIDSNTDINGNDDGNKITYMLPAMGGLTAGISIEDGGVAGTSDSNTVGLRYSMGDITAAYARLKTEATTKDIESTNFGVQWTNGTTTVIGAMGGYTANGEDRESAGVGIKQALDGGMYIAASTMESEDDSDISSGEKEKYQTTMAEMGYTIAPGLSAVVSYTSYDYKNGAESNAIDDDGTITKLTIKASF